jgi:hypothetical protein
MRQYPPIVTITKGIDSKQKDLFFSLSKFCIEKLAQNTIHLNGWIYCLEVEEQELEGKRIKSKNIKPINYECTSFFFNKEIIKKTIFVEEEPDHYTVAKFFITTC